MIVLPMLPGGGEESSESADLIRLLHELEVHQVELELQNEELRRAQEELEASRNEYLSLYNSAPAGFMSIDSKGLITRMNRQAEEMFLSPGNFLIGTSILRIIHSEDHPKYLRFLSQIGIHDKYSCELRMIGRNGTLLRVRMEATARFEADGSLARHFIITDITRLKEAEAALRRSKVELERSNKELERRVQERTVALEQRAQQLARLSSQLTLAEQRERRRLGVIIHDHLQQVLVGAKIHLEVLAKQLGNENEQQHNALDNSYSLLVESIKTARSLSTQMAPQILYERGLVAGLEWLARSMQETYQVRLNISSNNEKELENDDVKVLLFESVRELLFNVVKHSKTSEASVEVSQSDSGTLRITVSDRGVGFDPEETFKTGRDDRFGLFSVRERLELIGGSLEVESKLGSGTEISLIVPIEESETAEAPPERTGVHLDDTFTAPRQGEEEIRVLLVDDHVVMRQGLSSILHGHSDIQVVGEAADGEEAVQKARELHPDVILMDISMPKMSGTEATRIIHSEMPYIRIIGLSMYDDPESAQAMTDAGAISFLTKSGHSDALIAAIREELIHRLT
jgi:PAS domain S-box-containing protein